MRKYAFLKKGEMRYVRPPKSKFTLINRFVGCIFMAIFLFSGISGCAHSGGTFQPHTPAASEDVMTRIDEMIDVFIISHRFSDFAIMPAAVMPGAVKTGRDLTRLETMAMDRLKMKLRKNRDIITLSRQNWFEFREGRALELTGENRKTGRLVVYEVDAVPDVSQERVQVRIVASDEKGQAVAGLAVETSLSFGPEDPARMLYETWPTTSPFPVGMEERPYVSMDRLAFSLATELEDAWKEGLHIGGHSAPAENIRVMLTAKASGTGVPGRLDRDLVTALKQNLADREGIVFSVGRDDLDISSGKKEDAIWQSISAFESATVTAGTVLLVMETVCHPTGDMTGVSLRAFWRTTPLEDGDGDLIGDEMAGTYLSGATARAYLSSEGYPKISEHSVVSVTRYGDNHGFD